MSSSGLELLLRLSWWGKSIPCCFLLCYHRARLLFSSQCSTFSFQVIPPEIFSFSLVFKQIPGCLDQVQSGMILYSPFCFPQLFIFVFIFSLSCIKTGYLGDTFSVRFLIYYVETSLLCLSNFDFFSPTLSLLLSFCLCKFGFQSQYSLGTDL